MEKYSLRGTVVRLAGAFMKLLTVLECSMKMYI